MNMGKTPKKRIVCNPILPKEIQATSIPTGWFLFKGPPKIFEDTATFIVVYDTKVTLLGNTIQGKFRYLRIWKLFADNVKVIGGRCFMLE